MGPNHLEIIVSASVLFFVLIGCVADVGKGKVAAEVSEPAATEPAVQAANGEVLSIDTTASTLKALSAKVTATHPIIFHEWSGHAMVDGENLVDLEFTIEMASLESNHPKLTQHLLQEDFFWVEKYPHATFDAQEIKAGGEGETTTHTVTGDLTIRGKTKRVSFPATIVVDAGGVKANTEFSINRQDFAITYVGRADDLVQDNVVLTIALHAPTNAG